jgi:hypothetical protein
MCYSRRTVGCLVRWVGPLIPLVLGVGFWSIAWREQRLAAGGRRRFPFMSQLDLLAGPFALAVYGLAFVAMASGLWFTG